MNSYASPTPVIEEGRVYVHFGSYLTACLDTKTFETIWERRVLECDHHRGPASSPILFDGKLFVAYDGFDVQYVVAFDKVTGSTVWRRDRDIEYGTDNGDLKKAYGTASVIHVDEQPLVIYPSAIATIAYDPATGHGLEGLSRGHECICTANLSGWTGLHHQWHGSNGCCPTGRQRGRECNAHRVVSREGHREEILTTSDRRFALHE